MIRPPASSSVWLSGRPSDFPCPRYWGVAFCGVVLIFPTSNNWTWDEILPFSGALPKGWELNHHHTITWRHREGGNVVEIGTIEISEGKSASVRIVLLKYAELLVLSIAEHTTNEITHRRASTRKFWIWAGDALFAGVVGGVNRELNWFKLNQSYRLRKVGCLPARDMLVRD